MHDQNPVQEECCPDGVIRECEPKASAADT